MIFPMPCWMIISPAIMRSTLKARGLQAANVSIMTLPSSFLQLIRIALQCSGKVHRDNKNRRDFAKQQRNNVRAQVSATGVPVGGRSLQRTCGEHGQRKGPGSSRPLLPNQGCAVSAKFDLGDFIGL